MSLIQRLRRGDKSALVALFNQQGAAVDKLLGALGGCELQAVADHAWRAAVVPPVEDDRGFMLMAALASFAAKMPKPIEWAPEVDPVDIALQVGRAYVGGDMVEQQILQNMLAVHPEVSAWVERLRLALAQAQRAPIGASGASNLGAIGVGRS